MNLFNGKVRYYLGAAGLALALNVSAIDIQVDGGVILSSTDILDIQIDPDTNMAIITTQSGEWDLVDNGDGGPPPSSLNVILRVDGLINRAVIQGETVDITWDVAGANSCTTQGGDAAWQAQTVVPDINGDADGSLTLTVNHLGTVQYTLSCVDDVDTESPSVNITGNEDNPPPPSGACPEDYTPSLVGDLYAWEDIFDSNWPMPTYDETRRTIRKRGYMAVEFNTGNVTNEDGGITAIESAGIGGERLIAISQCAGDFSEHLPDTAGACTALIFDGGSVQWDTSTNAPSYRCQLELDTTYFLNVTFTDGIDSATDRCTVNTCKTVLRTWHY